MGSFTVHSAGLHSVLRSFVKTEMAPPVSADSAAQLALRTRLVARLPTPPVSPAVPRMKPLRLLLLSLGSLVFLVAVIAVLALSPWVQTRVAHRFTPSSPECAVSLGRVAAGLHRSRVDNLRVVQPGLVITVPSVEVDLDLIAAARGQVAIKRLAAHGWVLDLTAPLTPPVGPRPLVDPSAPAAPPAARVLPHARAAFEGLLARLNLPVDLAVDGVDLSGDVLLPEGQVHVVINGGGLAAGKEGTWALSADANGPEATRLTVRGNLSAHLANPRAFDRLELALNATVTGAKIPPGANLALNLRVAQDALGETYAAALSTGTRELIQLDLALPRISAPLSGSWKLDVTTADARPFALGHVLPDFAAKGQGRFSAEPTGRQVQAAGMLEAWVDQLGQIRPELTALGRLVLVADFDFASHDQTVRLNRCELRLSAGAAPLASVSALQPIEINRTTGAVAPTAGAAELMRVELNGLPLAWAQPFLGDIGLAGQDLRGVLTVSARNGGVSVSSSTPLTLLGLSVSQAGQLRVRDVDVSLALQADYGPQGWSAEVSQLTFAQAQSPLVKLTAKAAQASGAQQPLAASGTYEVVLPALLGQPLAAGKVALSSGLARGGFSASVGAATMVSLTVQLTDLIAAKPAATRLPAVVLLARADVDESGRFNAQLPVVITRGVRRSEINLRATGNTGHGAAPLNAQITAGTVYLDDLLSFAALASPAPVGAVARVSPAPAAAIQNESAKAALPPAAPLWADQRGELKIDIQSLVYSRELQITGINGLVKLTADALNVEGFGAGLSSGGRFSATGGVRFEPAQAQPYALKADVSLVDLDSAPLLRALSPGRASPLEGKFRLTTQLAGRAVSPLAFGDTAIGDITLGSQGGVLRVLSVKAGANADTVATVAAMAGLFGSLAGSEATVKKAEQVRAAAVVAKQLSAIAFTQLNVVVGRDEQKNLAVKDLSLTSPQIRLTGTGQITQRPGVPLIQQPLRLDLKLGARPPLSDSLRTLKLVDETATDAQGYAYLLDAVVLDGSLQSIGTGQLQRLMDRAMAE